MPSLFGATVCSAFIAIGLGLVGLGACHALPVMAGAARSRWKGPMLMLAGIACVPVGFWIASRVP